MKQTRTHRRLRPWIAFVLSAILLIQSTLILTFHVSAENASTEEPTIVAEDVTKRTANEKHFICSVGSMMAVSYARPVHYELDGVWKEIDIINDCHYEFGPNTNGKYPANKCNDIGGRDAVVDVQDLIKAMRRGGYHQDPDASLHGNQCMMYHTNA